MRWSRTWWLPALLIPFSTRMVAQGTTQWVENRGQWPRSVTHRAETREATIWLESGAILIDRYDATAMEAIAHAHVGLEPAPERIRHHAFRMRLSGVTGPERSEAIGVRRGAFNYIQGNDPTRWGRNCHAFSAVVQHDVLPGIDLRVRALENGAKYDLICAPSADPGSVRFQYDGLDSIHFAADQLTMYTSLGVITESIPIAYQEKDGVRIPVDCIYSRKGEAFGFELGAYDRSLPLVIDPTLIFSTYSGSFANNFGYTATFDRDGFLYSGSSAFGQGYPTTLGAYQTTHAGGDGLNDGIDIALTKYDTTGTFLVWSTFLGGSSDELPHSLVVNDNDELFVYGTTSSSNFPTTPGAFDVSFNGGPALNLSNGLGANYPNGTDIIIARLSADGSDLLASTFIGGANNDGMNTAAGLKFNYADEIRGEVLLDANDNVYVASSTASTDFPTTSSALQPVYGGGAQDGVLMKFDASLTTLSWCTYLGGSQADAVYNIELNDAGGLYIAGGTRSPDLPVSADAFQQTFQGGTADGFVAEVATDGTSVIACTYFGSPTYDQCYFADLDQNGDIYLFGQTQAPADMFIINAAYSTPNAGQFIAKLDPALTTIEISTRFGQGDGQPDISPTAFLVDYCNKIYVSGWGSSIQGGLLSTTGLPVTADAFQSTTDGNDFYLAVLDIDLSALFYATYFGGGVSAEHVDGGTSRFDRRGRVYQSVCAGCGGNSDIPIHPLPGAVSPTNNSGLCNNAVFKFDMDLPMVVADFNSTVNCLPAPVSFSNASYGASSYEWSFGDNSTSTQSSPSHVYATPGVYTVRLVASNPGACNLSDTTYRQVVVLGADAQDLPDTLICAGGSAQIGLLPIVGPGITYTWSPTTGLSNASVANPVANPTTSTTYTLTISNGTCSSVIEQTVVVRDLTIDAGADRTLCGPNAQAQLVASGYGNVNSFQWSSSNSFSDMLNTTSADSTANIDITAGAWYHVRGTNGACQALDSVYIDVSNGGIGLDPVEAICSGDTGAINLFGADPGSTFNWSPEEYITQGQGTFRIWTNAPTTTTYSVTVTSPSGCTWNGSAQQAVSPLNASSIQASANPLVLVSGGNVQLQAFPSGLSYSWLPQQPLDDPFSEAPIAIITSTTRFTVTVSDGICAKDASVLVEVRELICDEPDIFVPNTFTPNGDGKNDVLYVRGRNIATLDFKVFDRWGELVFETTDVSRGWDGTYEGRPVDPAVFVYHLTAYCVDGQQYFTKGNVTVVR
ncbi:MAG TPA: gliding motility-associated C-terminal domain-containing protein [Flavobacteriales bacterium]|nr:gliding motility-associated C-terminal domain-containing protein [Flavobacteriales bacterium]